MRHLSPAEFLILRLGGVRAVARVVGRHHTRVARWARPRAKGGHDGQIPRALMPIILDFAESEGVDLTAIDLIRGRDLPEAEPAPAEVA